MYSKEHTEGRAAFYAGSKVSDNPYTIGSKESKDWLDGHQQAYMDDLTEPPHWKA